jgi:hypothetical protein
MVSERRATGSQGRGPVPNGHDEGRYPAQTQGPSGSPDRLAGGLVRTLPQPYRYMDKSGALGSGGLPGNVQQPAAQSPADELKKRSEADGPYRIRINNAEDCI